MCDVSFRPFFLLFFPETWSGNLHFFSREETTFFPRSFVVFDFVSKEKLNEIYTRLVINNNSEVAEFWRKAVAFNLDFLHFFTDLYNGRRFMHYSNFLKY